jgi:ABC-type phosphate/phosphonate transport system substrate-binding protein
VALASLPMYDQTELVAATDAWWAGLARAMRREGVAGVPDRLARGRPYHEAWREPGLLLSQSCGYHVVGKYRRALRPVATPCYAAQGCAGPSYTSWVVVRETSPYQELAELRGTVAAINGRDSHSGMNALRAMVAALSRGGRFFARVLVSGGHRASARAVAERRADVAAIDCVSYALYLRCAPDSLAGLRILGRTASVPGLPYVTRAGAGDELVQRLRAAVLRAMADPDLTAARESLLIAGAAVLEAEDYEPIAAMRRAAARQGYPRLA